MPSPSGATAKYGLPYLLETDAPDVATASQDLAQGVENILATAYTGLASARPAAGKSGRWYYATDTNQLSFDNGSAWVAVPNGPIAVTLAPPSYTTTSVTFVCVDSTNAKFTGLVAPASGKFLMTVATLFNTSAVGGQATLTWSNGTTNNTNLVGTVMHTGTVDGSSYRTLQTLISGLTPGTAYTFALQWANTNVAATMSIGNGTDNLILTATPL